MYPGYGFLNSRPNILITLKNKTLQLPVPDADAIAHSHKLVEVITEEMHRQGGQITFEHYMSMVLYHPGLGYYASGSQKFGAGGDFVTAPQISSLFSWCLARQCCEILNALPADENRSILEFGAGTGIMAADILLELEKLGALPDRYYILEVSADLRQRQQTTLENKANHLIDSVDWLDRLPDQGFSGVVLANEVLDAMPVHRFYKKSQLLGEYYVAWQDSKFVWREGGFSNDSVEKKVRERAKSLPEVYLSEINLAADAWISAIGEQLRNAVVLIIDYGFPRDEYYHPQRNQGSLMCHYRHHSHEDPFLYPGLQDITAHVDFSAVAEAADAAGLHIIGYTNQAFFLLGNKVDSYLGGMDSSSPEYLKLAQQLKTLTMPGEMGELFKVIALGRNFNRNLQGFALKDDRYRL